MNKAALCIKMLQLLNTGKIFKISELANILETNPRNIIEYKNELVYSGYNIISISGKYGGYKLDRKGIIPSIILTKEEQEALSFGASYLYSRNDFIYKNNFELAISKIYSSINNEDKQEELLVVNMYPLEMSEDDISKRYLVIDNCIRNQVVLEIDYINLKLERRKRKVEPYKLYMYNNMWYFIGFDEIDNDFRYFKLNRIKSYRVLEEKFHKHLYYNESKYLDEYGMKVNGEWYKIKIKITGIYSILVRDRIYGKNQSIEELDDESIILSCEMQNIYRVVSFILSMGNNCEVLESEEIKKMIKDTIKKMYKRNCER